MKNYEELELAVKNEDAPCLKDSNLEKFNKIVEISRYLKATKYEDFSLLPCNYFVNLC